MPRGYYLGQGLIPLGYSSSDDEEGPCELTNGRLVCGPHGMVVCGRCCTDYSFMEDVLDDDDDDDEDEDTDMEEEEELDDWPEYQSDDTSEHVYTLPHLETGKVRGTGRVFPTKFVPADGSRAPLEEFSSRHYHMRAVRRTHRSDKTKLLLMTDGACLNNGQPNPRAGWAFYQGDTFTGQASVVSGRLEARGPWGDPAPQTNNRAELRAVLAALRFRGWSGEGFKTIVIATDSSYVVDGATGWVRGWVRNDWRTKGRKGSGGQDVKNRDLWEMLLGECERYHGAGVGVQFWRVPREWNTLADAGAREGAARGDAPERWGDIMGIAL